MIDCPTCGQTTTIGLPQDATIESVTRTWDDTGERNHGKTRSTECGKGHLVRVSFSYQRDIDPLIRKLQTSRGDPLERGR